MPTVDEVTQSYVTGLAVARDGFLDLRRELGQAHPDWRDGEDARLNLVGKPANLIMSAIVNLRLTQHAAVHPQFWRTCVAPELNTEAIIAAPLFELGTFYRFGFFQFLMSSIEHGMRAIQPIVVEGLDTQADQAYWKIYTSLFKAALAPEVAARHGNLFAFLSALRNTIHNNGVYYPQKHADAAYDIGGKNYTLVNGKRLDLFGWEHFVEWLPLIQGALRDLLRAKRVVSPPHISDLASFASPGVEHHAPPA